MDLIFVNDLPIEIKHESPDPSNPTYHWSHDKIYIHDTLREPLTGQEVDVVIEYLYNEGFIQDRRTPHTIVRNTES